MDHYQHSLGENPKGINYLQQRGITNIKAIKDFGTGFADGSLKNLLPQEEKTTSELKTLGILNGKGNEVFYNCVVFPLYDQEGAVVNLYDRNISGKHGTTHLYLAGSSEGLVNRQAVRRSKTIILTESIIDGLTLYAQGFTNVIPVYGVNGLSQDHLFLFNGNIQEIFLAFDNDQAGIDGMARVGKQLEELGIGCHPVTLPAKDCNLFFKDHGPEEFEQLMQNARPQKTLVGESKRQSMYQVEERGFRVGYNRRQYQIKGIQKGGTQLKATIKASSDLNNSSKEFELTTIDLYSSRSRAWFAKLCAHLFGEPEALIKQDIVKLMTLVEEYQPSAETKNEEKVIITPQDKKLALAFLRNRDIFSQLLQDFDTLGVTGEEINKLVGYLAATSRKLADPL
ncbi:MAG: toprim domain-containing protein, partial [Desulfobacterales bacterium]|nr:toprim domain-containing protein [Desulfobacterales bacterium]